MIKFTTDFVHDIGLGLSQSCSANNTQEQQLSLLLIQTENGIRGRDVTGVQTGALRSG